MEGRGTENLVGVPYDGPGPSTYTASLGAHPQDGSGETLRLLGGSLLLTYLSYFLAALSWTM